MAEEGPVEEEQVEKERFSMVDRIIRRPQIAQLHHTTIRKPADLLLLRRGKRCIGHRYHQPLEVLRDEERKEPLAKREWESFPQRRPNSTDRR